jgi:molybdate transport system substrate-binding protein
MSRRILILLFAAGLPLAPVLPAQSPRPEVTIAAAANLNEVFQRLGPQFEAATGIHPVFSFASTAQLTMQIENGAPYDVFAAADTDHIDQLDKKGLLVAGSRAVYATGVLALWVPPGSHLKIDSFEDLAQPGVKVVAIARPELAPYGQAAVEALRAAGLWDRVQPKVVFADNINMAKQYGASGNADAVLTAYSLVLKDAGKVIPIESRLHRPIDQALGIIRASQHQPAARQFTDFVLKGKGRDVLLSFGYRLPDLSVR